MRVSALNVPVIKNTAGTSVAAATYGRVTQTPVAHNGVVDVFVYRVVGKISDHGGTRFENNKTFRVVYAHDIYIYIYFHTSRTLNAL